MKVLCTICARGGSKGVKNKNIRNLRGKPLLAHSILQAKNSKLFDKIAISSDSEKIRQVALDWGADYVINRPDHLSSDIAPKLPAIQHAVEACEIFYNQSFDIIVDLSVTSPLRSVDDIISSYNLLIKHPSANNVVTGYTSKNSPYFSILEVGNDGFVMLSKEPTNAVYRRQDVPISYDMNGSIYVWRRDSLFNSKRAIADGTLLYVMPEERSVDIDTMIDWKLVRLLANNRPDL